MVFVAQVVVRAIVVHAALARSERVPVREMGRHGALGYADRVRIAGIARWNVTDVHRLRHRRRAE